jgi:hypothetical protein
MVRVSVYREFEMGMVQEVCTDVIENHYPDMKKRDIAISIQDTPGYVGGLSTRGIWPNHPSGYTIYCGLDTKNLNSNQARVFLKGLLGHEFAHIYNGELDGLQKVMLDTCRQVKGLDKLVKRQIERRADIETIRRGLGKELLETVKYVESTCNDRKAHMSSSEIESRINAQSIVSQKKPLLETYRL